MPTPIRGDGVSGAVRGVFTSGYQGTATVGRDGQFCCYTGCRPQVFRVACSERAHCAFALAATRHSPPNLTHAHATFVAANYFLVSGLYEYCNISL